jgi:CRP-like cAMP-binding protein
MSLELVNLLAAESPGIWSRPISLKRGEHLTRIGEVERYTYFIRKGALRAYIQEADFESTIRLGYTGNIMNALPSFLTQQPSHIAVEALKASVVIRAKHDKIRALIKSSPRFANVWLATLEKLFPEQLEREIDLLHTRPEDRYARVLKRSPELFQEIPARYIADYLRMTPETLSRLKKSCVQSRF